MSKTNLSGRILIGRTTNLGDYNSRRIELEISGELSELEKYDDAEVLLKKIAKQMGQTIEDLKIKSKHEEED